MTAIIMYSTNSIVSLIKYYYCFAGNYPFAIFKFRFTVGSTLVSAVSAISCGMAYPFQGFVLGAPGPSNPARRVAIKFKLGYIGILTVCLETVQCIF